MFNAFRPTVKKPLTSSMSPGQYNAATYAPNLVQSFGQSLFQQKNPISPPVSMQSKAPVSNVSKPIQASGMSSQYASNPTNYKPVSSVQGGQQYQNPLVVPNKPAAPAPSASQNYMSSVNQGAANQTALAEKMRADAQNFKTQQNTLANQQLASSGQDYQNTFNQFKGDTEAQIAANAASGDTQKAKSRDYYEEAQLSAAKARRQSQGQTAKTFANLGIVDGFGEGSFAEATANQDSAYNSYIQTNLKEQAQKFMEIDSQIQQAERTARAAITTEQQKMTGLLRDIEYAKQNNNLQLASQLTDDYNKTQSYIYDIADNVQQMKYSFSLEQEKLNAAQEAISQQMSGLSDSFKMNGVPQTSADQAFIFRNPSDAKTITELLKSNGGAGASNQKASGIIDQLLTMDTNGLTGAIRLGTSYDARAAQGLLKQLSSELQIEEAKRLKGQGAMSDSERQILANSIAAFNLDSNGMPNISDERFKQVLTDLKAGFNGTAQSGSALSQDQISQILAGLGQ